MLAFLSEMSGMERIFIGCAVFGGILFIIRLVMQFAGADTDAADGIDGIDGLDGIDGADGLDGLDGLHGADAHTDVHAGDSDYSFKFISFQGLTAFFTMFGLVGLAMLKQSGFTPIHSIIGGAAGGIILVWIMKRVFEMAMGLQSSGNIRTRNAIGAEGSVYLTIRAGETGRVQVVVQNRRRIFDAKSADNEEIKTGQPIRVVDVISASILVVEKID